MFVDDKTTQYLVAILKAYKVRYIVTSPGAQNAGFNYCVQNDKDFKCISVIDERSAAYVASGIAEETGEPVVITCTGATSSRNYLPALTEAYYRRLPIIALTYTHYANKFNQEPQYLDRSVSQNDVKRFSIELPVINNNADKYKCLSYLNAGMCSLFMQGGPIHFNVVNPPECMSFNTEKLPTDFWKTEIYKDEFSSVYDELQDKRVGIFIGSHKKFSEGENKAISKFAESYNAPVFCDHSSQYHGANKILTAQIVDMLDLPKELRPQIMIDLGTVSGEYSSARLFYKAEYWRITPYGEFNSRYGCPVKKIFNCSEETFFKKLIGKGKALNYYQDIKAMVEGIKYPELPLCNALISQNLAKYIPNNSSLHLGILNSLRNMNFFDLSETINVTCNVGGFGIDGPVSTMLGHSLGTSQNVYGVIGDLATIYDMNILGNHNLGKNFRLIVVNNGRGEEFRVNTYLESIFSDKTDDLVAAAGHNKGGIGGWAIANGMEYMQATNEQEFLAQIQDFCTKECNKPILFEVYTQNEDEQNGLSLMRSFNKKTTKEHKKHGFFKKLIERK